jgi:peptidyl-prolyl cis-trans isomerase B (cyclophilin B)
VASKKDRQRKLAREAHQRRQERRTTQMKRQRIWAVGSMIVIVVVAVGLGLTAVLGGFSSAKATSDSAKKTPATTPSVQASATPTPSPSNTAALVDGKCQYIKGGTAARTVNLPPAKPDTKATYAATIKTNRGTVVIDLMNNGAPCTVNSFVSLADQKYFNNTPCHRLTTSAIFVLQCGDPSGTGEGVPGYGFGTENTASLKSVTVSGQPEAVYPAAMVAMANTGQPDSNGSQFFLVYKQTDLPPSYTPFGTIVSGLNILQNVAKAGSDNSNGPGDGHPKEKVQIESVTISKT